MNYERIVLPPNEDCSKSGIGALIDALGMNVLFDDVSDGPEVRFCFQEDESAPIVDYEASGEDLDAWYRGERFLELDALPHDPDRFDMEQRGGAARRPSDPRCE